MKKLLLSALALCSSLLLSAQSGQQPTAYVVSNAHLDTQWNWDIQTTINEYIPKTVQQNLWLLDNYPGYIFNWEGGVKYAWIKEYDPVSYERVRQAIKTGRWHVSGASWDANDPNIPSVESSLRNILLGQEFYKKEFGIKSTDIFLPDCFGFSYTLPTVARHCGLIGFSTQKLAWRKYPFYGDRREPFSIGMWKGIDGSQLMAALDCGPYVYNFPEGDLTSDADLKARTDRGPEHTAYRYYGAGDTGGSPSIWSVMAVQDALDGKGKGLIKIISASSDQIFKNFMAAGKQFSLPVYDGELLMDVHATGCYTSQSAMKQMNRRNEQLADAAERASVMADWLGAMPYPAEALDQVWKRFLWHQFHDDLTGTSIPRAYEFSWNDEIIAQSQSADIMRSASGGVVSGMDTRVKGTPVVVYNPAAYLHTNLVQADVPMDKEPKGVAVLGPDGKAVPAQLVGYAGGKATILFAATVQPVSFSVYDVRPAGKSGRAAALSVSTNTIENSVYRIELNAAGDISSIVDKRYGKQLVKPGEAIGLALFNPNESSDWPAWEILKATMDAPGARLDSGVNITVTESGPLRATLMVVKKHGGVAAVQYISLTDGASDDRIDIVSEIDWESRNSLLKMEFPLAVANPSATYDLGLGHIERGNNTKTAYEVFAQHWADITSPDGSYGVSILNDCKYGWDKPADDMLRLTFFHAPHTVYRYSPQETMDFGRHRIACAIVGHQGGCIESGVVQKGEELNQPMISYVAEKHAGYMGREFSFISTTTPQIALKMMKLAENGESYVVRVYETAGKSVTDAGLVFAAPIEWAKELNGIEEVVADAAFKGNTLKVSATKFQPKTYAVRLRKPAKALAAPLSACIELPYNNNAISPDAFRPDSDADNSGNSYAAELIPGVITSAGVDFRMGRTGVNNVMRCKGDTIALPADKPYNKLYILAAATDRDRQAVFSVDGKPYRFDIPYYSDLYGQWGRKGMGEGFVKDGSLVHVGSHRHNPVGNEAYVFTYMYKLAIDLPKGALRLVLPDDSNITVFAITASVNSADMIEQAADPRVLPPQTKTIGYVSRDYSNLLEGQDVVELSNPRRVVLNGKPQRALDGNPETMWIDNNNDIPGAVKFIEIDMGAVRKFNTWKILHAGNDGDESVLRDFKLMVRNDRKGEWQTLVQVSGNSSSVTERRLDQVAEARYARLEISKGNARDNIKVAVREFQLYNR